MTEKTYVDLVVERDNGNVKIALDTSLAEDLGMSMEHIEDIIRDVVNNHLDNNGD